MTVAPAALVTGAPRLPLPYGLFSQVTLRPGGADRWENGVTWEELTADAADGLASPTPAWYADPDRATAVPTGLPKDLAGNTPGAPVALPFIVYGHWQCSPVGFSPADAQDKANEHLTSREEARVEQAIWTGDLDSAPFFTDAPTDVGGGAVTPTAAVGLLEEFIAANYGSLGLLHLPRRVATYLLGEDLLEARNGRLFTRLGTPTVAGSGYGSAAQAIVTPAIFGYRGEIITSSNNAGDLLDRTTNDLYAVAERTYLLGYDAAPGVGSATLTLT